MNTKKWFRNFGLVVIDASRSIEEQQQQMRQIVTDALAGMKKTRIRKWLDLSTMVKKASRK
jgi:hypothetical protein